MKKMAIVGVAVAAALLMAGCSSGGSGGDPDTKGSSGTFEDADPALYGGQDSYDDMAKLYEKAKKDGETSIVVYGAVANEREEIFRQFEKEFPGIKIQTEFLTGSDLFARINQEIASGKVAVDSVLSGDTSVTALKAADRLEKYAPVLASKLDADYVDPDGHFYAITATPFGVAYNTDMVSEDEIPHSWKDMVDPKFKGKLTWVDLTGSGPSLVPTARLLKYGDVDEQWLRDLKAQDVHWEGRASGLSSVITTGEYPIAISYPYDYYLQDQAKQAPVGFFFPLESANYVAVNSMGIVKGAPHPTAAKLLESWLLTPAADKVFVRIGQYSLMPGSEAPKGLPKLESIDQVTMAPVDEIQEINKAALEITKKIFQ